MTLAMSDDPRQDKEPWQIPKVKKAKEEPIPLDEAHTCPFCEGKGFVRVIPEPKIKRPFFEGPLGV